MTLCARLSSRNARFYRATVNTKLYVFRRLHGFFFFFFRFSGRSAGIRVPCTFFGAAESHRINIIYGKKKRKNLPDICVASGSGEP